MAKVFHSVTPFKISDIQSTGRNCANNWNRGKFNIKNH